MKCMVTGAYGYSGRYITHRLLAAGATVSTLTGSPGKDNPFGEAVKAHPFNFNQPDLLARSLEGVDVLVNTYWVRFNHKSFTQARAVRNSEILFVAARRAGVKRIVHISITNPSEHSPLEYFHGKADPGKAPDRVGPFLQHSSSGRSLRQGGHPVNNIAWMLRRLPVFGVFGDGRYKIQPIYVDDLAALVVTSPRARRTPSSTPSAPRPSPSASSWPPSAPSSANAGPSFRLLRVLGTLSRKPLACSCTTSSSHARK